MKANFLMTAELCNRFNTKRDVGRCPTNHVVPNADIARLLPTAPGRLVIGTLGNRNWCVYLYSFTQNRKFKIQISKSGRCFSLLFCHILLIPHVTVFIQGPKCRQVLAFFVSPLYLMYSVFIFYVCSSLLLILNKSI